MSVKHAKKVATATAANNTSKPAKKKAEFFFRRPEPNKDYLAAFTNHLRYSFIYTAAKNNFAAREEALEMMQKAERKMRCMEGFSDCDIIFVQRESERICREYKAQYAAALRNLR